MDLIFHSCAADPFESKIVLSPGDGGGRHAAAVASGRVNGEPSPTRADLQHVVLAGKLKLLADAVVLGHGGLLKGAFRTLENAAGVSESLVQEQSVEVIAQVIVSGNIDPAPLFGVLVEQVISFVKRGLQPGQTPVETPEDGVVEENDPEEDRQVVGGPVSCHVSLAGAESPGECDVRPGGRVEDGQGGVRFAGAGLAEAAALRAIDQRQ